MAYRVRSEAVDGLDEAEAERWLRRVRARLVGYGMMVEGEAKSPAMLRMLADREEAAAELDGLRSRLGPVEAVAEARRMLTGRGLERVEP